MGGNVGAQVRRNVIYNVYVFEPMRAKPPTGKKEEEARATA